MCMRLWTPLGKKTHKEGESRPEAWSKDNGLDHTAAICQGHAAAGASPQLLDEGTGHRAA